jgi:PhzF family phenazine biosynthesis protein
MSIPIYHVDAFTSEPFHGNPAAVCLLQGPGDEAWMQSLAAEMNLSETAFVWPEADSMRLRWFAPSAEVDLCGHATLATAHVLWETGRLERNEEARFMTKSGLLTAVQTERGIALDFPATPPTAAEPPASLIPALGISESKVRYVGRSAFDYLVEVDDETTLRALKPDFAALKALPVRGIIVVSAFNAGSEYDFVSRFFGPSVGVDEDPATGSSHCCLGPHWAEKTGRTEFTAYQASARGGWMRVAVRGERVELTGNAVTVLRGELAHHL